MSAGQAKGVVNCIRADLNRGGNGAPSKGTAPEPVAVKDTPDVITWAKIDDQWFARVPTGTAHEGDTVEIVKRDGTTARARLGVDYSADPQFTYFHAQRAQPAIFDEVPDGHYALPVVEVGPSGNDLAFYRVKHHANGRVYVRRVVGGHPEADVPFDQAPGICRRILDAGVRESAVLYADNNERCAKCNRQLTAKASRDRGIGPECLKKAEW